MDDKNNINELNDNLDGIAPNLSKLKKGEPFALPGDYFDDLASKIQEKCAEADELREIAPVLSEIPKYNPFAVPDGYFDELPLLVQERWGASRRSWKERFAWLLRPAFSVPAAIAVIALAVAFVLMNDSDARIEKKQEIATLEMPSDSNQSVEISSEALMGISETAIIETLLNDDATNIEEEHHYVTANEDEIIDYLVEHNADVSYLVNEL